MSAEHEAERQADVPPSAEHPPGTIVRKQPKPLSQRDPGQLAQAFAKSGYWKHVKSAAQAVVVMAAGEELGLTPLASLQGITIIEGRVGYTGNLIAQLLRQHERYDYKILERSDESCTLQFTVDGEPIDDGEEGKVTFSIADAQRAELVKPRSNWLKYPRAMCFNRALTEGARLYCPDLTAGTPVYSTEEIEEVIHVEAQDVEVTDAPAAEAAPTLPAETVEQLVKGYEIAGPELGGVTPLDGLNLLLGELGIDAFEPGEDIAEQLARLTSEQAVALNTEFAKVIDQDAAEEVDAEVVEEDQERGEADADA